VSAFRIRLSFEGHGWLDVRIHVDSIERRMHASYIRDTPLQMIEAANLFLKGIPEASFSFEEEPGEWRWLLVRDGDSLSIRVIYFTDARRPSKRAGEEILRADVPAHTFARALKLAIDELTKDIGDEEYEKEWGRRFPCEAYDRLTVLLKSDARTR
jgi:hypothetical protein